MHCHQHARHKKRGFDANSGASLLDFIMPARLSVQAPVPVVALVGYTNAGKSTLLNKVTEAAVLAEDKLFATLDPTTRRVSLPSSKEVCILFPDTYAQLL